MPNLDAPVPPPFRPRPALARREAFRTALFRQGLLEPEPQHNARSRTHLPLSDLSGAAEAQILDAARAFFDQELVTLQPSPEMAALVDRLGLATCQRFGVLPWRQAGSVTVVATARPEIFASLRPQIEAHLGPVIMTLAPSVKITDTLLLLRGPRIAQRAQSRVAAAFSARGWGPLRPGLVWLLLTLGLLTTLWLPQMLLLALTVLPVSAIAASTGLKLATIFASHTRTPPLASTAPPPAHGATQDLPAISILVGLYQESSIAPRLVRRLARLDYPRHRLEIVLAIEEDDLATRAALEASHLPIWMKIVRAPRGALKTKPRALNVALDHCFGDIIGVYDAEDAPSPDQLHRVAERFRTGPQRLACLQGVLDFYNPKTNWLARCFTIEYAGWFRAWLPGLQRLGLILPLGGTTFFIRREVLEEVGAWDAHNVTEDADLGLRLARQGYRTEMLASTTFEEANCRAWPWVKQRSRWIKGHIITWAVHMRSPRRLLCEIGPWRFWGVQVMFLGSALQTLLAPFVWSFWLLALGLPHPLADHLTPAATWAMLAILLSGAVVDVALGVTGLARAGRPFGRLWVLSYLLYQPLACFAAYKAFYEVLRKPFYWDKTSHGHFDPAEPGAPNAKTARAKGPNSLPRGKRLHLSDAGPDLVSAASARPPRRANVFRTRG